MLARVSALLFCSGLCALVYQMVWLRLLRLVFGASHSANAAVLAIFMGGLGLGGLLLGRLADRSERPLRLYGRLELGITLAAVVSPALIGLVRMLYLGMGGTLALGEVGGTGLRLALSAVVLGVPTVLMGGTLPAVVRAVERAEDVSRRGLGVVYGANTAGAVTGACLASFYALETFGAWRTLALAAVLNVAVALVALWLPEAPRSAERAPEPQPAGPEAPVAARTGASGGGGAGLPAPLVLGAAAAVGFAFLLMELVWSRMLSPILGGSTYTFGLVLAVALAGIGAGGLLYGVGSKTRAATPRAFALTCALEAVFLAVPLALGDRIALLAAFLRPMGETGFGPLVATWTLIAVLVVLPASLISGYQFPLLVALLGRGDEKVGRQVGLAYASNTVGSILGSLAGGFGLLPLLGAVTTWRCVAIGLAGLSALTLLRSKRSAASLAIALVATVAVTLSSSEGPTAVWRHSPIGAGRFQPDVESRAALEDQLRARRRAIVWEVDGVETSVGLDGRYGYSFVVNGKSDGHVIGDAPTFVMHGLLGTLLHPEPKTALVVGLGTGETAGWLARVEGMEQVDVVELEPAIEAVARLCGPVNFNVMDEPRVRHFPGDGREHLLTTAERYDVIVNEPSNPYRAGIASLFTVEFYEAVQDKLTDEGLFVQWLQAYDLSPRTVRTVLATLGTVFPHVEIFESQTAGDLLLVASNNPVDHDLARIAERTGQHPYQEALSWTWGVSGVEGLYSAYVANQGLARAVVEAEEGRLNTDDHPFIEYEFARNVGLGTTFSVSDLLALSYARGESRPLDLPANALDWGLAQELRHVRAVAEQTRPGVPQGLGPRRAARAQARSAWAHGELRAAATAWPPDSVPVAPLDQLMLADALARLGVPEADVALAQLDESRTPTEVAFVTAELHFARGETGRGRAALVAALDAWKDDAWGHGPVLQRGVERIREQSTADPRLAAAVWDRIQTPWPVSVLEEYRHQLRLSTSLVLDSQDQGTRCVEALEAMEPHVPWSGPLLARREACYARAGHWRLETAREELARFSKEQVAPLHAGLQGAAAR